MDILIKIAQLVVCLSLLVIVHEFGHFMFAKIFKVRVEKFYLFFDPWFKLFSFKRGETEYGVGWLPLGGYVSLSGMIDETKGTDALAAEPQPWEFRTKPAWQRLLIMAGGVMMNVVLACCIYIGMSYTWGDRYFDNKDMVWGYTFNELGHEIGFEDGDRILSLDGQSVDDLSKIYSTMVIEQVKCVHVLRGSDTVEVFIRADYTPQLLNSTDFMLPRMPFEVAQVLKDGGAAVAGIQEGDRVTAVNGESLVAADDIRARIAEAKGGNVELTILRGETTDTLTVAVSSEGAIGVYLKPFSEFVPVHTREYTFWQSIPVGIQRTGEEVASYWSQIKLMFKPKTEAYKSLGSFIAIGSIFPTEWDWYSFWRIAALLSVVFAVMNILPIPGLDGGHIVFVLWEMITGRKPSDKVLEYAQMVGMILLIALMIFAFGNDIRRFIL
ncbi:MAG: RIP metalloprotease RseP [Rikenellaceae bacterium]|nr:RIP metalloprotease RseP [Rikenellaceae bacterium]